MHCIAVTEVEFRCFFYPIEVGLSFACKTRLFERLKNYRLEFEIRDLSIDSSYAHEILPARDEELKISRKQSYI